MSQELVPLESLDNLAKKLNDKTAEAGKLFVSRMEVAWECGEILLAAKSHPDMKHGDWRRWVKETVKGIEYRQCAKLMKLRADYPDKSALKGIFGSINAALGYLPEPDDEDEPKIIAQLYTGKDEWYTPVKYIEAARTVMGGIDCDPASNDHAQETVRAETYYTMERNGLDGRWHGNVWMNPPYSRGLIDRFVDRLHNQLPDIKQSIVLTNNNTDTGWWHDLADISQAICFTKGRISFHDIGGEKSSPTNGQTFFYIGENVVGFSEIFSQFGLVFPPV